MLKETLTIILIIIALWWTYSDEFFVFKKEHREYAQGTTEIVQVETIEQAINYDHPDAEVWTTPDLRIKDRIIDMIDDARDTIEIEVYIFTETKFRDALIRAHNRGVDIRVLVEKNPYGAPTLNNKILSTLERAGIKTRESSEQLYTFIHSKLMLIDDVYIVSTGNFSHSAFAHNKEIYLKGDDPGLRAELGRMFEADWNHERFVPQHPSLTLSPENARESLTTFMRSANESLDIYGQHVTDEGVVDVLLDEEAEGTEVRILMGNTEKAKSNLEYYDSLEQGGVEIQDPKKPYIHAKGIIVDDRLGWIGSVNFTENSLDRNREIGIYIDDVSSFDRIFEADWR